MKRVQKILAAVLAVVLLVSSGVPGMASVFATDGKDTEAVTERTTEHAAQKTIKSAEAETAHTAAESEGKTAGNLTESETQKQTESETQKQTESETQKQTESETQKQTESETAETKKPLSTEPETQKPETQKTEKPKKTAKAEEAGRVSISNPKTYEKPSDEDKNKMVDDEGNPSFDSDFKALIPDKNFRQAIYDNFEQYNWLSGDPENPPSTTDENGNPRARIEILKDILGTYKGRIEAKRYGIKDISGIHYLKLATAEDEDYEIDLRYNEISSLMPLTYGGNYSYGGIQPDGSMAVVKMNLSHNPIVCFPDTINKWKIGYVSLEHLTNNATELTDSDSFKFYHLRNGIEKFSGYLEIGCCKYEDVAGDDFVEISRVEIGKSKVNINDISPETGEFYLRQTSEGPNRNENVDLAYYNLERNMEGEDCRLSIFMTEFIRWHNWDAFTGDNTDKTSYSYPVYPSFTIFDHVTVNGSQPGSARAHKYDIEKGTEKPLKDAQFSLYRKGETGADTLIEAGLTTDETGYTKTVKDLEPGSYYFQETKAPDGYMLNEEKQEFTVGYSVGITGGLKRLNYVSADQSTIDRTAGYADTYVTQGMGEKVAFCLQDMDGEAGDESIIDKVTVHYSSLDGNEGENGEGIDEPFSNFEEAEKSLNANIDANKITGAVTVSVEFKKNSEEVENVSIGDWPTVKVKVDKTWLGIRMGEELPTVTYKLHRYKEGEDLSGEGEIVNSHTIEGDLKKETENGETAEEENLEADTGGTGDSIREANLRYSYEFTEDSEGRPLPKYGIDGSSAKDAYRYVYKITEEVEKQGAFVQKGDIGEAVIDDEKNQITIPVTNYKKPSILIQKYDADASGKRLQGAVFKLEKKTGENTWEQVGEEGVTDQNGELWFKDLEWGVYRITETQAPETYILLADPIDNIEIKKPEKSGTSVEQQYVFMVGNSKKYRVPNSGGVGNMWFLLSGGLLLLAGGIWGYRRRLCMK